MSTTLEQLKKTQAERDTQLANLKEAQEAAAKLTGFMKTQTESTIVVIEEKVAELDKQIERMEVLAQRETRDWSDVFAKYPILETAKEDTVNEGTRVDLSGSMEAQILKQLLLSHSGAALMEGPTGSGKTTMFKWAGAELNLPVVSVTASGGMKEKDLIGEFLPTPEGTLEWVDGPLVQAMRAGVPFVLEEINVIPGAILAKLNGLLDANQSIMLPAGNEGKGELVKPTDGFFFGATMNNGYQGTRTLNRSLVNRFSVVMVVDSMTPAKCIELLGKIHELSEEQVKVSRYLYESIQNAMKRGDHEGVVTLRQMDAFIKHWNIAAKIGGLKEAKTRYNTIIDMAITNQVAAFDEDIKAEINRVKAGLSDTLDPKDDYKMKSGAKPLYTKAVGGDDSEKSALEKLQERMENGKK